MKPSAPDFDAQTYLFYLRSRWRLFAIAIIVAALLSYGISHLLPRRYTSTASILIEAPAGTDPRTFTAISPVYLESLKTYELIASSDTLFLRALDRFHIRDRESTNVESLKARVLKASKLRDTKVLQISVTLPDPRTAQAMAEFLANETVRLTSAESRDSARDLLDDAQKQADSARANLQSARDSWARAGAPNPAQSLQAELDSLVHLLYRLRTDAAEAEASRAEFQAIAANAPQSPDAASARRDAAAMAARAASLTRKIAELEQSIAAKKREISQQNTLLAEHDERRRIAERTYEAAERRLLELRHSAGSSGERLHVIDPGIVPEKPSEPKTALNVIAAVVLAAIATFAVLTLSFTRRA